MEQTCVAFAFNGDTPKYFMYPCDTLRFQRSQVTRGAAKELQEGVTLLGWHGSTWFPHGNHGASVGGPESDALRFPPCLLVFVTGTGRLLVFVDGGLSSFGWSQVCIHLDGLVWRPIKGP